jgi:hypothetical protein
LSLLPCSQHPRKPFSPEGNPGREPGNIPRSRVRGLAASSVTVIDDNEAKPGNFPPSRVPGFSARWPLPTRHRGPRRFYSAIPAASDADEDQSQEGKSTPFLGQSLSASSLIPSESGHVLAGAFRSRAREVHLGIPQRLPVCGRPMLLEEGLGLKLVRGGSSNEDREP